MPIRCANCGLDNRDTAQFCASCGHPVVSVSYPSASPLAAPLQSQRITPSAPSGASAPPSTQRRPMLFAGIGARSLTGLIETYNESEVYTSPSHAWALTKAGVVFAVLPFVLSFVAGLSIILLILVLIGGAMMLSLIALVGKVIGFVGMFIRLLLPPSRAAERRITLVSLGIEDQQRSLHRVVIYGDHIAGMLRQGDIVEVYGRRQRSGRIVAHRVVLVGRKFATGSVQPVTIKGQRKRLRLIMPMLVWAIAIGVWLWMFGPLLLVSLGLA